MILSNYPFPFTIIGSGFGLYGYLPALVNLGCQQILLPSQYHAKLKERNELLHCLPYVKFVENHLEALNSSVGAIIATWPIRQEYWVEQCIKRKNLTYLILEKPISAVPTKAISILEALDRTNIKYRVSYIFRYTSWGKSLLSNKNLLKVTNFNWLFRAHHYQNKIINWKRNILLGGGAISFYGIHIIALLAEYGYTAVADSRISCDKSSIDISAWKTTFISPSLPNCSITLDTDSNTSIFSLFMRDNDNSPSHHIISDPFANLNSQYSANIADNRIACLEELLYSLAFEETSFHNLYFETNKLWDYVLHITKGVSR